MYMKHNQYMILKQQINYHTETLHPLRTKPYNLQCINFHMFPSDLDTYETTYCISILAQRTGASSQLGAY